MTTLKDLIRDEVYKYEVALKFENDPVDPTKDPAEELVEVIAQIIREYLDKHLS
jgi:hypothetical protein